MFDELNPPILDHAIGRRSAFTAEKLMEELRRIRDVPDGPVPPVCILEFDGDLTDWLVQAGIAEPFPSWACFHTKMFAMNLEGIPCGIIARTIGGPYAVLIAEQLHAAGAKIIIGLTSAGRLAPDLPLPCLLVATSAIRDEGTSYHYLAPSQEITSPTPLAANLERELAATGWHVRSGKVWTTDAPYRETPEQIDRWASENALAVEMQTASLFAFGAARHARVASVVMVSNAVDHQGEQFDTGSPTDGLRILKGIARAAQSYLETECRALSDSEKSSATPSIHQVDV
jgi:uridine phosphorylase